jgi:hypothetical protein
MKRTFAAAAAVAMAGASVWLATAPADAKPAPPKPPKQDSATIKVVPKWTYEGGGKLAITTQCSGRKDVHVVSSKMLPHMVDLRGNGNLLVRVTDKTKPGKYSIALWCVPQKGHVDSRDLAWVKIVKRMPHFKQPAAPAVPRNFKAEVTVSSGPAVGKKPAHGTKKAKHGSKKPYNGPHLKKPYDGPNKPKIGY